MTASHGNTYDDMNRLTGASGMDTGGKSDDGSAFSSYVMTMSYNQMSSPQRYELTKMSQSDTNVTENEYLYSTESSNPHAPMQIGDMTYTYSASGNPLTIEGSKKSRSLTWDAENRLRELTDQRRGIQSRYTYNHTGERSLKRYGAYESMAVNGAAAGSLLDPKSAYSAYVSPYYVEHGRGTESGAVTKHYYAGAERLASKVVTSATGAKGESQNGSQSSAQTEESTYYYFTDHLGSTTHITDRSGRTSQYAAYTPYGELFREYKKVLPYKFNGKELDQETGYYYYGARYYDPGTALWFGTDPLAGKYPSSSPYSYCEGNPIVFFDNGGEFKISIKSKITVGLQWGFKLSLPKPIKNVLPETVCKMTEISGNIVSVTLLDVSLAVDTESGDIEGVFNFIGKDGILEISNELDVLGFSFGQEFDTKSGDYLEGTHKVTVSTPISTTNIEDNGDVNSEIGFSVNAKKIIGVDASIGVNVNSNNGTLRNGE